MTTKSFFFTPKGSNQWYRYPLFLITITFLETIFSIPAFIVKSKPNPYLSYFQLLFPSAMLVFSIFWALKWIHKSSGFTLINANKIRWKRIFWAMGCFGCITLCIELISAGINPSLYQFSFDKNTFFQYLLISLTLIPFQSAGEEMIMRGYLMQGIAWATKRPWLAILCTSIIFGLLHLANPEIKAFGYLFILNYIFMGLAMGIVTIMDDGAEIAIGVHIVNNLYSAIMVTFPSSVLKTSTIFTVNEYNATFWTIFEILTFAAFIKICQKKYHWSSFKLLFEKLDV